ncbi:hypothetical protein K440DRAFT_58868 [Wilcoxina mikolae CBS 423.85]|nr:hypothetical protein K440DRAFT_58868 [Wilcoxina mikolae CBS 423.85]
MLKPFDPDRIAVAGNLTDWSRYAVSCPPSCINHSGELRICVGPIPELRNNAPRRTARAGIGRHCQDAVNTPVVSPPGIIDFQDPRLFAVHRGKKLTHTLISSTPKDCMHSACLCIPCSQDELFLARQLSYTPHTRLRSLPLRCKFHEMHNRFAASTASTSSVESND